MQIRTVKSTRAFCDCTYVKLFPTKVDNPSGSSLDLNATSRAIENEAHGGAKKIASNSPPYTLDSSSL